MWETECISCVTEKVLQREALAFNDSSTEEEIDEEADSTSTSATRDVGENTVAPAAAYSCHSLRQDVCDAIASCGDEVCSLVDKETVLTFGRDCEDLFLQIITCSLDSQGSRVITEQKCALEGTCEDNGNGDEDEDVEQIEDEEEEDKDGADGAVSTYGCSMSAAVAVVAFAFVYTASAV